MTEPQPLHVELGLADFDTARRYVRDTWTNPDEQDRRNHAARIDAHLSGQGAHYLLHMIRRTFVDPFNQEVRSRFVEWSQSNSLLRRVSRETATIYIEPARRSVSMGDALYQDLLESLAMDAVMRNANRMIAVQEAAWISMRVRDGEPVLDVLSPARFAAIPHATDPTLLRAIVTEIPQPPKPTESDPAYLVQGRFETFTLNRKWDLLRPEPNALAPNIPGVLVTMTPPSVMGRLLPLRASMDLVAAEEAVAYEQLLALKESKSATRQAYISGDTNATTMGQAADSEREIFLGGDGVSVSVVDRSMDLTIYGKVGESIADTTGANYGLPPSVRKQSDATSGAEAWLRRAPLLERRREQIDTYRRVERRLASHMAAVVDAAGLDEFRFSPSGWAIDFGELSAPLTEAEELANFRERRALGIDDTLAYLLKRNPDLTLDQATEEVALHAERESARIEMIQGLSAAGANTSTAVGDHTNGGRANDAPVNSVGTMNGATK